MPFHTDFRDQAMVHSLAISAGAEEISRKCRLDGHAADHLTGAGKTSLKSRGMRHNAQKKHGKPPSSSRSAS